MNINTIENKKNKRYWFQMFNEKKRYPITGIDKILVQKIKEPTMRTGSKIVWKKYFDTELDAKRFLKQKLKIKRIISLK